MKSSILAGLTIKGKLIAAVVAVSVMFAGAGGLGLVGLGITTGQMEAIQSTEAAAKEFLQREIDTLAWQEAQQELASGEVMPAGEDWDRIIDHPPPPVTGIPDDDRYWT